MGAVETLTFAVAGMHCASCGMLVDETLEDLDGVERSDTDSRRGRTVVRVDAASTSVANIAAQITAAIAVAGYTATLLEDS